MNVGDSKQALPPAKAETSSGDGERNAHQRAGDSSRENFSQDFRRFFVRGLAALMPTLITLWLLLKVWEFLWGSLGVYIIFGLRRLASATAPSSWLARRPEMAVDMRDLPWYVQVTGVMLAIILVYLVGLLAGNFLGRTAWRLAERAVMRIPLIRAIYPAVKQVTDFVLAERGNQFAEARVVAVEPHAKGIWSIGLVTGPGMRRISESAGVEMITVFVPSSPTAFSGYVLIVPRDSVVELPLTVEQAMRVLVSGGVIDPDLMLKTRGGVGISVGVGESPDAPASQAIRPERSAFDLAESDSEL